MISSLLFLLGFCAAKNLLNIHNALGIQEPSPGSVKMKFSYVGSKKASALNGSIPADYVAYTLVGSFGVGKSFSHP
jgi:hypothetical protein